jgi:DNA-3-methyladenine glycosylase II
LASLGRTSRCVAKGQIAKKGNSNLRPIIFSLEPAPPFSLELTVWALRRRPDNAVDRWDGETYRRALPITGKFVEVAVIQTGRPEAPRLGVSVTGARRPQGIESSVTAALNRMLGLQDCMSGFYRLMTD